MSSNPSPKQLLVSTLKGLHRARNKALFKLKSLNRQGRDISSARREARLELDAIHHKMTWEINTNGKRLRDRQ